MIKKIFSYSLVFLLSLLIFLIATMPASVIWHHIAAPKLPIQKLGVKVLGVEGTIWSGKALIKYRHLEGIVAWELGFADVLLGEISANLSTDSALGQFDLESTLSPGSVSVLLPKAEIALAQISPFLKRERVTLDGYANLNNLSLEIEGLPELSDVRVVSASGRGSWSGGEVAYPVGRNINKRDMPPFYASLETEDDGLIRLSVRDPDASFDVIDATLDNEGVALLQVKRRLLDLAGERARHKNETDVVFKIKKPLY